MSTPMVETVSTGLGQRVVDRLFTPAFLFWAAGALLYLRAKDNLALDYFEEWSQLETLRAAATFVFLVTGSSLVVEYLQFPVLRFLEGYWHNRLSPLRQVMVERRRRQKLAGRNRWTELRDRFDSLSTDERREYASLDTYLARFPPRDEMMPTMLGNVMKTAELHAWRRYRLASVVAWPRLWLAMPQEARDELAAARRRLDRRIGLFIWSALLTIWSCLSPWALVVALAGLAISYRASLAAASTHGELFRSAFDLYHRNMVAQLGWDLAGLSGPLPLAVGNQVTLFLFGGQRPPNGGTQGAPRPA